MMLASRSILLVEDDITVASDLERILKDAGYIVIGPAGSVAEALVQIVQQEIDAAVLNIRLGQELTTPVLDVLAQARVPFILVSDQSLGALPRRYRDRPFVKKPYLDHKVLEQLTIVLPAPS